MRTVVAMALFMSVLSVFAANSIQSAPPEGISAIGKATIEIEANQIVISAQIEGRGRDMESARKAFEAGEARFISAMAAAGIPEKDVLLTGLSAQKSYDEQNDARTLRYCAVNKSATIIVNDLTRLAPLMASILDTEAVQLFGIVPKNTHLQDVEKRVLENAYKDAKARAETLASISGVKLGPAISITDLTREDNSLGITFAAPSGPLSVRNIEVEAKVKVLFALAR